MFFLKVHIAGWILLLASALSIIARKRFLTAFRESLTSRFVSTISKALLPAFITVAFLFLSYYSGKSLPFRHSPLLYNDITTYVKDNGISLDQETAKVLSFCGMGNIARCKCELAALINSNPFNRDLLEIWKILYRGESAQKESEKFLR